MILKCFFCVFRGSSSSATTRPQGPSPMKMRPRWPRLPFNLRPTTSMTHGLNFIIHFMSNQSIKAWPFHIWQNTKNGLTFGSKCHSISMMKLTIGPWRSWPSVSPTSTSSLTSRSPQSTTNLGTWSVTLLFILYSFSVVHQWRHEIFKPPPLVY